MKRLVIAAASASAVLGIALAAPASASTYGEQGDHDVYTLTREMRDDCYTGTVAYWRASSVPGGPEATARTVWRTTRRAGLAVNHRLLTTPTTCRSPRCTGPSGTSARRTSYRRGSADVQHARRRPAARHHRRVAPRRL